MSIEQHKPMRVHIFGASGSGTTTFGRALASFWSIPHHDTDDYYWEPTEPPFQKKRSIAKRLTLMEEMFLPRPKWVLSGSLVSWSETLIPYFDVLIFLNLKNEDRLERIQSREEQRYGKANLAPGGSRHKEHHEFMLWNEGYEKTTFQGRNRRLHENWIRKL